MLQIRLQFALYLTIGFAQFVHEQLFVTFLDITLISTVTPLPLAAAAPVGIKAANAGNDEQDDNENNASIAKPRIHFIRQPLLSVLREFEG
jgi:hypothetical protein